MDGIGLAGIGAGNALTTDRKSARPQRIEVITRGERRRAWSVEQKREIVLASLRPGARPADIAREHGINTGLLYTWRRQMVDGRLGEFPSAAPSFARVEIAGEPTNSAPARKPSGEGDGGARAPIASPPREAPTGCGLIEIVLPHGVRVRVDARVDPRALRRILSALEWR